MLLFPFRAGSPFSLIILLTLNCILLLLILLASPSGLPDRRFMLQFVLTAPPQNHEPSISSTISLPICEPLSISPTSYRNSPMGPPPFIKFPSTFCLPWGIHYTGAPVSVFCTSSPIYFSCTNTCYYKPLFLSSPLATCFPFGHTQPMSPLVGVFLLIFPLLTSSISSEHDPGHLPPSSAFIYFVPPLAQLTSDLVVPMTLDLVPTVAATPCLMHPPTKGSLESSHFLTSSMYLCHLITSVDSMEYLLLLGVASPFCRHQHTFPKGRQYLDPHFPF
jgi:hypothetical protein